MESIYQNNDVKRLTSSEEFLGKSQLDIDSEKNLLDVGILGKLFGGKSNAPYNISGAVLIIVLLTTIFSDDLSWDKSLPVITLILGFLFGKHPE